MEKGGKEEDWSTGLVGACQSFILSSLSLTYLWELGLILQADLGVPSLDSYNTFVQKY